MQTIQIDPGARRWTLRVAMLGLLAALFVGLASVVDAQSQQPKPPHWFWGRDADAYAGASVVAVDASGDVVSTAQEGSGVVGSDGAWYVSVSTEDATRIKLRLVATNVTRETGFMDVVAGGFDEDPISISAFAIVEDAMDGDEETLAIRIRARVYPSDENPAIPYRSIEFNLSIGNDPVELNDNPRERTIRPNHASGRWYYSNWFDLGDGFEAAIIACKDQDGGVRFGVRVEGRDDIIPRQNLLPASRTSTGWARSNVIDLPLPGSDSNPDRAGRGDDDCQYGRAQYQ